MKASSLKSGLIAAAAGFALSLGTTAWADDIPADLGGVEGLWMIRSGQSMVRIADCGDGTPCGYLTGIEDLTVLDTQNPDPALRDQPLEGLLMISGFKRKGDAWKNGTIYNPNDGKSYRSSMKIGEGGLLELKGCVGPFCQKQRWRRVENTDAASN